MRLISPWTPRLANSTASPSSRLVAALAEDILEGQIDTGDRLPAHRDLADRLGISVGTVTKAYNVLERRGLVRSVKGRGTFVALAQTRRRPLIDLSRNVPPSVLTERLLARTLTSLSKHVDSDFFNDYPPLAGHDEHRRLVARWFTRLGMETDPEKLVLTNGAHHAISLALSVTCDSGGTLFTEAQTYPGVISLTRHQGIHLVGLQMDDEGLCPLALEKALIARRPGPIALYVTPTMQNPTTATMSRERREAIVSICRRHNVMIIEDDVYTLTANPELPPLAMLAPELTFYANSLSKTLNPTLRIGGLVVPEHMYTRIEEALQATAIIVSPLCCAIMEQWFIDGTTEIVTQAIQEEADRRVSLAQTLLGSLMLKSDHTGYHVWLPMSDSEARDLKKTAESLGVLLTSPQSTDANRRKLNCGVRLCLGAPSITELNIALKLIADIRMKNPTIKSNLAI
ncbi:MULTISPECIES: PLP-dependent aminotransferase family protein [Acetobacter]|uniref:Putative HTH-type transcriptional regulator n=1 Tax=Acetobacter pomorum DM001 TaxID=945681 RepID=F1YR67_9PROT|nr:MULTISPECIES: PLP-dependent aminotransferase family protein [Acetobacter]ATI11034.1 PLP-dependent aminotransferase family protein [Acetobacter pomorum]AXC26625.1 PLP-dependent aminotransferase family protein [Acetobacter sp. JWB]EGE48727.1 Putative HTH-type transcriptional regulator [Acetobacter pomorum DM001]KAA8420339.1 PLP-dependent aminotransferase family protein [Acetobacter pomorum]KAA8431388.1 PLP-dependent aminotransferase family protein [Acetobacter pomorum]